MSSLLQPEDRVLSTLNADGSRRWINPKLVKGKLWKRRRVIAWLLIALFVVLPHVMVGGRQWVFLDFLHREFTFFGKTFFPTDTLMLAIGMIMLFVLIFFVTALFGRVWCGWACPQTVYLDFLFRPIDRWLGFAKGGKGKVASLPFPARRVIRWGVYVVISFFLANTFLAYFVGSQTLRTWVIGSPIDHVAGFIFVILVTGLMLFNFLFFREQLCMIACPYGRFQSVMLDGSSLVVGYDRKRGEPRGKAKRRKAGSDVSLKVVKDEPAQGDCVDCNLCVAVCPTGIDIRDGLQLECIHCAACIDACNSVMTKIGREPGLIRYSSQQALETGKWRMLRPRVILYPILLLILALGMAVTVGDKTTFDALLVREKGLPFNVLESGEIANQARLRLTNRTPEERAYSVKGEPGLTLVIEDSNIQVEPREIVSERVLILAEPGFFEGTSGRRDVTLTVTDDQGAERIVRYRMFGPTGG